jgi:hypothetical protein
MPAINVQKEKPKASDSKGMLELLQNQALVANLILRFLVGLGLSVQRATFKV